MLLVRQTLPSITAKNGIFFAFFSKRPITATLSKPFYKLPEINYLGAEPQKYSPQIFIYNL
jgi:hypothetical protein